MEDWEIVEASFEVHLVADGYELTAYRKSWCGLVGNRTYVSGQYALVTCKRCLQTEFWEGDLPHAAKRAEARLKELGYEAP